MNFTPGSLVTVRDRDWVVLTSPDPEVVMVRPLGGTAEEITGILTSAETVTPAGFEPPNPTTDCGDAHSAGLLRDALRLGFRSGAGPFRSAAAVAVEPRPYQLVPLLMALRLDPVRLLIADDVGVGKTIEAALVARELLETGDAHKLAVLCPPHLAEQWQHELSTKFHIEPELVLASTAARLERNTPSGKSIFEMGDHFVVSLDFIKSKNRREAFIAHCPDLVIVDEAHTCAAADGRRGSHQRHSLIADIAKDPQRHLILVTATPHSGKDDPFRSLLGLLDRDFLTMPDSLAGEKNRALRERLARHLVQRRRADIAHYLQTDTAFPQRRDTELNYHLSDEYRTLLDDVLAYARQSVKSPSTGQHQQRMRWWSALGLLRTLASSPAAAAATMRNRTITAEAETAEGVDEIGRRALLDLEETEEGIDVIPGSITGETMSRSLKRFAERADALRGADDHKLAGLVPVLRRLLKDGFRPVVFCRFIETAEYLGEELRKRLRRPKTEVLVTTGLLPPAERQTRVSELSDHNNTVLVTTDCLSEGINLQEHRNAVVHYDLPWNPTRLEQREGRVDRFGQTSREVRVVTYWGADNLIDESVLKVLLRKHKAIRNSLGISLPVPGATSTVIDALTKNVLLGAEIPVQRRFDWMDNLLRSETKDLDLQWDQAKETETRRRSLFAQHTIKPDEVAAELDAMREAIGSGSDVERFTKTVLTSNGAFLKSAGNGTTAEVFDLTQLDPAMRDALNVDDTEAVSVQYSLPAAADTKVWSRTHPSVTGLAGHVLDRALDPILSADRREAARCGVMRTEQVEEHTTLILCRTRMTISTTKHDVRSVAEETLLAAFTGTPQSPKWLPPEETEHLLISEPSANIGQSAAQFFIHNVLDGIEHWRPHIHALAKQQANMLEETHNRVRASDRRRGGEIRRGPTRGPGRATVQAQQPTDILGIYIYLPVIA